MSVVSRPGEPPAAKLYIGLNKSGQWIVRDDTGTNGGIFLHRRDALRYVMSLQSVSAVFFVPGTLELSFSAPLPVEETAKQPEVCNQFNASANAGR